MDLSADVFMISTPRDCAELAQVLADVWGFAESSAVASPDTLRAMAYSGCYVAGVKVEDRLIGGGFGWPTRVADEWRLHSHVIGFLDGHRALGLGARIKHHQRAFVRDAGLSAVEWTYDPLHAANARFNLAKLGARVQAFHDDFYGALNDTFSAGLGSDRFVVRWGLEDEPPAHDTTVRSALLTVGDDGRPVQHTTGSRHVRAQIPADIVGVRRNDTTTALAWRDAFAATVGAEVAGGATVVGMSPDLEYLIDRA
jgi:predicted GNAT superfamily acetyltransferase